jgi:hypothetical protein
MSNALSEDALILDGLNDAIAGSSDCGRLIYDYQKMLALFMKRENWTEEEAEEWVEYNVMGVQPNGKGFIMMYDRSMLDIEDE